LAERHEKGAVIITTNLDFADWTQVFGDPVMTTALLDRITHKAHIIHCDWESYRLKQSLKGKRKGGMLKAPPMQLQSPYGLPPLYRRS